MNAPPNHDVAPDRAVITVLRDPSPFQAAWQVNAIVRRLWIADVLGAPTMNLALATMIDRFRVAQDRAVAVLSEGLAKPLGIRLPKSNGEWVGICAESGLYKVRRFNDIEIYAHGYGIELVIDGTKIDFDWGDHGEGDGFDGWRLWNFYRNNGLPMEWESCSQVQSLLDQAAECGELTRDRLLFYSPAHRAISR